MLYLKCIFICKIILDTWIMNILLQLYIFLIYTISMLHINFIKITILTNNILNIIFITL